MKRSFKNCTALTTCLIMHACIHTMSPSNFLTLKYTLFMPNYNYNYSGCHTRNRTMITQSFLSKSRMHDCCPYRSFNYLFRSIFSSTYSHTRVCIIRSLHLNKKKPLSKIMTRLRIFLRVVKTLVNQFTMLQCFHCFQQSVHTRPRQQLIYGSIPNQSTTASESCHSKVLSRNILLPTRPLRHRSVRHLRHE
jgi:hypothetical protein